MQRAAAALEELVEELGIAGALRLARVREQWLRHPGPPVARHAWPAGLNGSTLLITVDSPSWLSELGFLKTELLRVLTPHGVTDVDLQVGIVPRTVTRNRSQSHSTHKDLNDESRDFIAEVVSTLEDPGLAAQVARTMRSWLSRRRSQIA